MSLFTGVKYMVVSNRERYHNLSPGDIVECVGFARLSGYGVFKVLKTSSTCPYLHDCHGKLPTKNGQFLRPEDVVPLEVDEDDDLYV